MQLLLSLFTAPRHCGVQRASFFHDRKAQGNFLIYEKWCANAYHCWIARHILYCQHRPLGGFSGKDLRPWLCATKIKGTWQCYSSLSCARVRAAGKTHQTSHLLPINKTCFCLKVKPRQFSTIYSFDALSRVRQETTRSNISLYGIAHTLCLFFNLKIWVFVCMFVCVHQCVRLV